MPSHRKNAQGVPPSGRADDHPPRRGLLLLARATNLLMFVVLIAGFLVTETGSAEGCGRHWPLCDGRFTPPFDLHGVVEWGHRFVSGLVGLLVLWLAIWVWRSLGRDPVLRWLAAIAVAFTYLQAFLGAAAVLSPTSPYVLAAHFGISLIAFAAVLLLDVRIHAYAAPPPATPGALPRGLPALAWLSATYIFGLVYLGALVAHSGTGLLCDGWPLCRGAFWPGLSSGVLIPFLHRVAALIAVLLVLFVHLAARRVRRERPELFRASAVALGLILLQALSGWYVVASGLALGAVMIHVTLMTLLFGAVAYLLLQLLPAPRSRPLPP